MVSTELRSRLVTLVLLVLIAGGLFVYARRADSASQPRPVTGLLYPGLDARAIDSLYVTLPGGYDLKFERQPGGRWRITEPVQDEARQAWVEVILDNLARAQVEPVEGPSDLVQAAAVGLEPPKTVIRFGIEGREQTLLLGEVEPLGRMLYARRGGEDRIVLATRNLVTVLEGHSGDFVEPALIRGLSGRVTSVRVSEGEGVRIDAQRTGDRWTLRVPEPVLGSDEALNALVRSLMFAQTDRTLHPRPTSETFHAAGLPDEAQRAAGDDAGAMRITLGAEGEQPVSVWLAAGWRQSDADPVAVVREGTSKLLGVPRAALNVLLNPPGFFRQKSVLAPIAERAESIRIDRGGETLLDIRRGSDSRWTFAAPPRLAGQAVEAERIAGHSVLGDYLQRIDALETVGFAPLPPGEPQALLVVGWSRAGQSTVDRVELFAPTAGGVPARTSERPSEGLLLPPSVLELVDPLQAELLRSTRAVPVDEASWAALSLEGPGAGPWRLVRAADGSWSGDDEWSRRYAIGADLAKGFRGLTWQPARAGAEYPWAVRFEDAQGGLLAGLRLRLPAADEERELWGVVTARAAVEGHPGVELVVAREWIDRIDQLAQQPTR